MSTNILTLSCSFRKFDWYEKGKEYRGKRQAWDSVRALVAFPSIDLGYGFVLGPQETWVAIDPPRIKRSEDGAVDRAVLSNTIDAFKNGWTNALVWNGMFNVWGGNKGQPKTEIKFRFQGFRLSQQPLAPLNRAIIQGRVSGHNTPQFFFVEDPYLAPDPDDPKKQRKVWKVRHIPVWYPTPLQAPLNGREVLVYGKVSTLIVKSMIPGQPIQTEPYLHVIAEELHACPS
jgi:hypothetical protein